MITGSAAAAVRAARPTRARRDQRRRSRCLGNTAVEFALLLPLFLLALYAIVAFSLMYAAQQSLTLAAAEGARAGLQYIPADDDDAALALRRTRACAVASAFIDWIQQRTDNAVTCLPTSDPCAFDATMFCLQVTLTYPYASAPLLPPIPLAAALTPAQINSVATVQIHPVSLTRAAAPPMARRAPPDNRARS